MQVSGEVWPQTNKETATEEDWQVKKQDEKQKGETEKETKQETMDESKDNDNLPCSKKTKEKVVSSYLGNETKVG